MAVLGATADMDLSALPPDTTLVVTRQPDFDRLSAEGRSVTRALPEGPATVIVCLPRARALAQDRIARAVATGARVLVGAPD